MSFSHGLKQQARQIWEAGYQHPFVQELGRGTLDKGKFQFYLLQDYHYLLAYSKVFALAAVKADTEELMARFTEVQYKILFTEMDLHRKYMAGFGITSAERQAAKPALYNRTYTANMLAAGQTGDLAEILAAMFPCAWTYADYAQRLKEDYKDRLEGNFYRSWIENYASPSFAESFAWFFDALDRLCASKTEAQRKKIEDIFISSVEFEYLFWDMSYKQQQSYIF
jgi:thiaminase/transcriptional activator TenA